MAKDMTTIAQAFEKTRDRLLDSWLQSQLDAATMRHDLLKEEDLRRQSRDFMDGFLKALASDAAGDIEDPSWENVRGVLDDLSRERARQGFTPSETASFIFSLKEPLFAELREMKGVDDGVTWQLSVVLDRLGLHTTELHQRAREDVVRRQSQEILELSTPVVKLWEGVVAVPLIGTLDSERTQVVMENLLEMIVQTGSTVAIIDITGVPTVDTLVAQHLIKTVAAARLMGAECIISGIRPQIAQTIVHLGIELEGVQTKASLADAIVVALARLGYRVSRGA
jgi:rsbT co-antagonist protein RsbR